MMPLVLALKRVTKPSLTPAEASEPCDAASVGKLFDVVEPTTTAAPAWIATPVAMSVNEPPRYVEAVMLEPLALMRVKKASVPPARLPENADIVGKFADFVQPATNSSPEGAAAMAV